MSFFTAQHVCKCKRNTSLEAFHFLSPSLQRDHGRDPIKPVTGYHQPLSLLILNCQTQAESPTYQPIRPSIDHDRRSAFFPPLGRPREWSAVDNISFKTFVPARKTKQIERQQRTCHDMGDHQQITGHKSQEDSARFPASSTPARAQLNAPTGPHAGHPYICCPTTTPPVPCPTNCPFSSHLSSARLARSSVRVC